MKNDSARHVRALSKALPEAFPRFTLSHRQLYFTLFLLVVSLSKNHHAASSQDLAVHSGGQT